MPAPAPTHTPSPLPSNSPSTLPTSTPTMQPYALVTAGLWLDLSAVSAPLDFTEAAETAFKKTLAAVVPALSKTSQVTAANATTAPASQVRRLGREPGRRLTTSSSSSSRSVVRVKFAVSVDVREAAAASGEAYSIIGPASDDGWATSNRSLAVATALVEGMVAELLAATSVDAQRRLARLAAAGEEPPSLPPPTTTSQRRRRTAAAATTSTWDVAAAAAVASLPVAATGGSLSLAASPGSASFDRGSVKVTICRFDDPCLAPTPGPTVARPSQVHNNAMHPLHAAGNSGGCLSSSLPPSTLIRAQVPTPAPTRVPDYALHVHAASAALAFVAFAQVAVCVGLFFKAQKRSREKQRARGDAALAKEQARFAAAHIVDLFGAHHSNQGAKDAHANARNALGSASGGPGHFTPLMATHMFNGLDGNGDALLTRDDLAGWLHEQRAAAKAGGFHGSFEVDEVGCSWGDRQKYIAFANC